MKAAFGVCLSIALATNAALGAARQHVVTFGKWMTVKYVSEEANSKSSEMKVRALIVDGRVKEFTMGIPHEITERVLVAQRAYRLNDMLPRESGTTRWRWERGGWLLIDRTTGKVQTLSLPAFDPYYSDATWFRDYAAYCGLSDDTKKTFTIVAQVGKRKPLLKRAFGAGKGDAPSMCAAAVWDRNPARVTFSPPGEEKFVFTVRSHSVDPATDDEGEDGE